jgi:hypothetical protein
MRRLKIRGSLLAHPSSLTISGNGLQIYRGFVGLRFPLFTEIDLCICEIDIDPATDSVIDLQIKVDLGVVKIGNIRPNIGDLTLINRDSFDTVIDTVDTKFYGVASDFRQKIWIDDLEQTVQAGWAHDVGVKQIFRTQLFVPKELQYDPRYRKGNL